MTDNQGLVPNNISITSDLQYNLKASSARGRSYRASIQPTNKSLFGPQDTAILYIPCGRRNTFLDTQQSYIKYTIKNTDPTNIINLDGCGACVINRFDVFHGSNLLESVQQYNVLYSYLMDFQINSANKAGLSSAYGFANSGASDARKGSAIVKANKLTVAMPLLSGVVGLGLDKMLPVGVLSDDIRCELTFEALTASVVSTTAATTAWEISNLELELTYIELSDEAMSIVNSHTNLNDSVFLSGNSWRHYVSSLPSGQTGMFNCLVPSRQASLKTLVCLPRRSTEIADALSFSLSSRVNPNIDSYNWRIGGAMFPQKYVTLKNTQAGGYAEGFMEIQKSWHSLNHPECASALGFDYFNVADAADATVGAGGVIAVNTAANSYKNGFAIATEMETYANKSDVMINGYNTLNSQVFFECTIGSTGPTAAYTLDFYANFDHILVKDTNGLLSVRF